MLKWFKIKLKYFDSFGEPIRLQINGDEKIKSSFGGFLTLLLVIFIGFTFKVYSVDCINKLNPQIYLTKSSEIPKMFLNQTYFRFKFYDSSNKNIDLTPYFSFNSAYNYSNCFVDKYNPEKITNPIYDGKIIYTNNHYCIDFNQTDEDFSDFLFEITFCKNSSKISCKSRAEIDDFFKSTTKFYFWIDTHYLDVQNYTHPVTIYTQEYSTNLYINSRVRSEIGISPNTLSTDDGFLYSNQYPNREDDNEYIAVAESYDLLTAFPHYCEGKFSSTYLCNRIYRISFNKYNYVFSYVRKYQRISDVLAKVGGISGILVQLSSILINFYCTFIRDESVVNHIYDIDIDEKENILPNNKKTFELHQYNNAPNSNCIDSPEVGYNNRESNIINHNEKENEKEKNISFSCNSGPGKVNLQNSVPKLKHSEETSRISSNDKLHDNIENSSLNIENKIKINSGKFDIFKDKEINRQLTSIDKIHQIRSEKKYRYRFCDLIIYYLFFKCSKNSIQAKKYEFYKKVKSEMNSILDIKKILYQTKEYENLKMAVLNNEQYALLNFITKINMTEKIDYYNKYNVDKNFLSNEENLRKIVNELLIKSKQTAYYSNLDSTTVKLINYLDPNIML